MERERKEKLLKYLFPTEQIRKFLCDDVYEELTFLIPKNLCISTNNLKVATRKENLEKVTSLVREFLKENPDYTKLLIEYYGYDDIIRIVNDIVIGYVYYLTNCYGNYFHIDIFKDKRSICYSYISLIDIL